MLLALAAAALALPAAGAASSYYVSSTTGDDSNAGTSPGTAWLTLQRASGATYGPGDSLLLDRGSIWLDQRLQVDLSAAPGASVGAYGDETLPRPLIEQARPAAAASASSCLSVIGADRATVSDLSLAGCAFGVALAWDANSSGTQVTVRNNFFRDIRFPLESYSPSAGAWGQAVSLSALAEGAEPTVTNLTLVNNIALRLDVFYGGGHEVFAQGLNLLGNTVEGCGGNCIELGHATGLHMADNVFLRDQPDRFFVYGTTDVIFGALEGDNVLERNDFNRRGETQGGPDGCAVDFETSATGVVVRDNTFYRSYGSGIMIFGHSTTSHGLVIDDNVFDHAGCEQTRGDRGGIAIMCPGGHKPSAVVSNNVFTTCPGVPAVYPNPKVEGCNESVTFSNNSIDQEQVVEMPRISVLPTLRSPRALPFEASTPTQGATLRYTLDGSRPTETSPVLPTPLLLPWTAPCAAVNVRAFLPGMRPSVTNGKVLELDRAWPLPGDGLRGNLDGIRPGPGGAGAPPCVGGWAVDSTLPRGGWPPVNVTVVLDSSQGPPLARVTASESRPDLVKAGVAPNPNHGFSVCFSDAQWRQVGAGKHALALSVRGSPLSTMRPWQLPLSPLCLADGKRVPC